MDVWLIAAAFVLGLIGGIVAYYSDHPVLTAIGGFGVSVVGFVGIDRIGEALNQAIGGGSCPPWESPARTRCLSELADRWIEAVPLVMVSAGIAGVVYGILKLFLEKRP